MRFDSRVQIYWLIKSAVVLTMETALTVDELGTKMNCFSHNLYYCILVLNTPQPDLKVISGKIVPNYFSSHIEADLRPIQRVGNVCLGFKYYSITVYDRNQFLMFLRLILVKTIFTQAFA